MYSPQSAVPYSFQCERVFAVISVFIKDIIRLNFNSATFWNEINLSTDYLKIIKYLYIIKRTHGYNGYK